MTDMVGNRKNRIIEQMKQSALRREDIIRLLPVAFFVSVVFLLVRVHEYSMPLSQFAFMSETDDTPLYDCFAYIKMISAVAVTVAAALMLVYYVLTGKRGVRRTPVYIPMAVYAVFIILSFIFSDYKQFALWGTFDRFEGTVIHLCYLFMMFYAINCVDSEKELKFIVDTLFIGVSIACLIGLSQLAGHDFFMGGLGKWLLLGGAAGDITLNVRPGQVYQTVYNINYVPFYLCLVIPLVICRIWDAVLILKECAAGEKGNVKNSGTQGSGTGRTVAYLIWLLVLAVIIVINIIGADSSGSIPGMLLGVIFAVIIRLRGPLHKVMAFSVPVFALTVAGLAAAGVFGDDYSLFAKDTTDRPQIEYIKTYDDTIEFRINGERLITEYDAATGEFALQNGKGEYIDVFVLPENEYRYQLEDDVMNGVIAFTPVISSGRTYAIFDTKDEQWRFEYTPDGVRYINAADNLEGLDEVSHADFFRNYKFGNGRGYIWDTTLPILSGKILLGSGADTFMMEFPQSDRATRYSHEQSTGCVYDKPHNMFVQMAVNFGIAGMLAFACMIVTAAAVVIGHFCNGEKDGGKGSGKGTDRLPVSVLAGIGAFLIAALVNDSSVQVMPMFYGLLGCACACSGLRSGRETGYNKKQG